MSVTAAQGFRAAGVAAGLKSTGKPDVALVVNDGPEHVAAGVFTSNRVVAVPRDRPIAAIGAALAAPIVALQPTASAV